MLSTSIDQSYVGSGGTPESLFDVRQVQIDYYDGGQDDSKPV